MVAVSILEEGYPSTETWPETSSAYSNHRLRLVSNASLGRHSSKGKFRPARGRGGRQSSWRTFHRGPADTCSAQHYFASRPLQDHLARAERGLFVRRFVSIPRSVPIAPETRRRCYSH